MTGLSAAIQKSSGKSETGQRTHLGLLDPALLEGAGAGIVGAVVSVFAPVALVRTAHTRQAPDWRAETSTVNQP